MGIFLLIVTFALFLLGNEILKGWIKINQKFPDKKKFKKTPIFGQELFSGKLFLQIFYKPKMRYYGIKEGK